jgi:hypothetical protein
MTINLQFPEQPMDNVVVFPRDTLGKNFIPAEYLPAGENEYYLRNRQSKRAPGAYRRLKTDEIERLIRNNNKADSWDDILVAGEFDTGLVRDNEFHGLIRIGVLRDALLRHHDFGMPAGITGSRVISCDIGDDVAIHNVNYLGYYIIGNRSMLSALDEMHVTNHAKFGNGILKDGEDEEVRVWLEVMNETGGRKILPFDGMIPADAYLWARYRDDSALQTRLKAITQKAFDSRRGFYGTVGEQCVIKNSRIIKDVRIGDHCYIKGANKIKNVTINSSPDEPTQIGEGVELVNGIIGRGCHVFYGCKAVRFILADNSNLKYGARLINSFLGENSTISCCEVLHNLIFPAHEQHHNNSFLIASVVLGQSNLAAGATVGSNHNSRSNDNEIRAGRGFWPGLCTSVKHSCRFASFTLLSKADYPAEMDIPLPFSLLNNNPGLNRLEIIPAWWWLYNMYALARNSSKFLNRDKRGNKVQHIEFESLAPDTVEEIIHAMSLLELWTGKADARRRGAAPENDDDNHLRSIGRALLTAKDDRAASLEVLGENMEKSRRKVIVLKPSEGYQAYTDMLLYYAIKCCITFFDGKPGRTFASLASELSGKRVTRWTNLGGQLVPSIEVDLLRADIGNGLLDTWEKIHGRYDDLWNRYTLEKRKHAFAVLAFLLGTDTIGPEAWRAALDRAARIQEFVRDQVYVSRKKDDDNAFRKATFRNEAEMRATIGSVEDNSFVRKVRDETDQFIKTIEKIKNCG